MVSSMCKPSSCGYFYGIDSHSRHTMSVYSGFVGCNGIVSFPYQVHNIAIEIIWMVWIKKW